MTDPIGDMLTRIRNALAVRKSVVTIPYSKLKEAILALLVSHNYIDRMSIEGEGKNKVIIINLNEEYSNARITEIKRLSSPGRRLYCATGKIPVIRRGRGAIIISTNKGVMTGKEAKQQNLGGELICQIY